MYVVCCVLYVNYCMSDVVCCCVVVVVDVDVAIVDLVADVVRCM